MKLYTNNELILNLFIKFIQKHGEYLKSKKLIINLNNIIKYKLLLNINFTIIIEYIIKKLILPIIMCNKIGEAKYYFLIISLFKYIKKFIFIPLLKLIRNKKKLPFIYKFLNELINLFLNKNKLIIHKKNIITIFNNTNANIDDKKIINFKNILIKDDYLYLYKKFKYFYDLKNIINTQNNIKYFYINNIFKQKISKIKKKFIKLKLN
uniref:Ribosomal protein S7 n=1 Tax=Babesia gibsoni TaxID=33632 RepID=A0A6M8NXX8_BABGI|nr:ribosomal protein S7 [Babesia gibsoni]